MEKEELKKIVLEQNSKQQQKLIKREITNKIFELEKTPFVIIISGIRRCGKSSLMNLVKQKYPNPYYLEFDDERLSNFKLEDFQKLYEVFLELYDKQNTFFFDEIQIIEGWERFVRRLHNEGKKVFITGSNATMLSYELGTHLTGRNIQIELFPFSFLEFLKFKNFEIEKHDIYLTEKKVKIKKLFGEYLLFGGFYEYFSTKENIYLQNLYNNILFRDVISRHNLVNKEKILKELINYLFSNVSKLFSYTALAKLLGLSNAITVKEYISYFENSYLIFTINKYDYSLRKQLLSPKKVYAIDTGFANSMSFKFSENRGRILENLVFLELKRGGKEIFYGISKENKECDLLIKEKDKIVEAIQVCKSMENEKTKTREINGLISLMKEHNLKTGLILTEEEEGREEIEGGRVINILPIWKWLLK